LYAVLNILLTSDDKYPGIEVVHYYDWEIYKLISMLCRQNLKV